MDVELEHSNPDVILLSKAERRYVRFLIINGLALMIPIDVASTYSLATEGGLDYVDIAFGILLIILTPPAIVHTFYMSLLGRLPALLYGFMVGAAWYFRESHSTPKAVALGVGGVISVWLLARAELYRGRPDGVRPPRRFQS